MTLDNVIPRLARLSSLPYQERYVLNGTIDEYITAADILDDVDSLRYRVFRPELSHVCNEEQRLKLDALFSRLDAYWKVAMEDHEREEGSALFQSGTAWTTLRGSAADALLAFGINAADLSVEDIDRMSD